MLDRFISGWKRESDDALRSIWGCRGFCPWLRGGLVVLFALTLTSAGVYADEAGGKATIQMPSAGEIARMRADLQAKMRAREAAGRARQIFQPVSTSERPPQSLPENRTPLRLVNEMIRVRGVLLLTPEGDGEPVQMPICGKGEIWLTLEPGKWKVALDFGEPGVPAHYTTPEMEIKTLPARPLELVLDREIEREISRSLETQTQIVERAWATDGPGAPDSPR